MSDKKKDLVNNPAHYNMGKFEVIDVIEDWKFGYHVGNVVKYVARAEYKGERLQDLKKALWYLERYMEKMDPKGPWLHSDLDQFRFDLDEVIEDWKLGFRLGNVIENLFRSYHDPNDNWHYLCEALRHLKRYVHKLENAEPPTEFQVIIPKKKTLLKG